MSANGDKSRCSSIRTASQIIAGLVDNVLDTELGTASSHAQSLEQPLAPEIAREAGAEYKTSFEAWIAHGRQLVAQGHYTRDVQEHFLADTPLPPRPAFLDGSSDDEDAAFWDAPLDGIEAEPKADLEFSQLTVAEQASVRATNPEPGALVKLESGELVEVP